MRSSLTIHLQSCSEPGCEKPAATAKTKLCSQHASRLPETRRDQKYRCPECIFGTNSSVSFPHVHACRDRAHLSKSQKTFDDHIHSAHLIKDYWKCKEPLCGQTFGYVSFAFRAHWRARQLTFVTLQFNNLTTHMSTVHSETGGVTCSRTGCDWRSSAVCARPCACSRPFKLTELFHHSLQAKALEAHERWHDPSHRRDKDRTCSDCRITVTVKGNVRLVSSYSDRALSNRKG